MSRSFPIVEGNEPRSWEELEERIQSICGAESAAICLLPDFVRSESVSSLGKTAITQMERDSLLIEVSVGYRVRLAIHLTRGAEAAAWPPVGQYDAIASWARRIHASVVSDRLVSLMSLKASSQVAWLYLNDAGEIESASSSAKRFCQRFCSASCHENTYLPASLSRYIDELLRMQLLENPSLLDNEGITFSCSVNAEIVHCLLRRVAGDSFLLSLSVDED
ncbi:hypothetical protein QEH54_19315 [Pelagicoccus sp. SDUM812003]|nr:hypothetical protein [Pelagicoccus sp. SDUM812003]